MQRLVEVRVSSKAEDHSSLCTQQLLYVQIDCRCLVCHKHFLQGMCEKFPLDFQLGGRGNADVGIC